MLPYAAARYVFEVVISEANVGADKHDNSFALGGAQLDHKGSSDVIGIDIRITDVQNGLLLDAVDTTTLIEARAKQVSGLNGLAGRLLRKAGDVCSLSPRTKPDVRAFFDHHDDPWMQMTLRLVFDRQQAAERSRVAGDAATSPPRVVADGPMRVGRSRRVSAGQGPRPLRPSAGGQAHPPDPARVASSARQSAAGPCGRTKPAGRAA